MVAALNSLLSGLNNASTRLEVSANNIANISSTATQVGGTTINKPYLPQDVVSISTEAGAVRTQVRDSATPTQKLYDPSSQQADENGFVDTPNVDIAQELVNQQIASYDYKATLKAIKITTNLEKNLLDIFS